MIMADNEIRDQLAALLAEQLYDRGQHVADRPEDERELYRDRTGHAWTDFADRAAKIQALRYRKCADALIAAGWRPQAEPVGYVTGYRNAAAEWHIPFDGTPFATRDEAATDAQDARTELPGVDWRALTVYDETGEPYRAGEH